MTSLVARTNRSYHYWHIFVTGVDPDDLYGFRASGPDDPELCYRFDSGKMLFHLCRRALAMPQGYSRSGGSQPGGNAGIASGAGG